MKIVKRFPLSASHFAMWRAAIALAYADHQLSNSEMNLIHEYTENFDFSEEQEAQFDNDLRNNVYLEDVFPLITDKMDRAKLINFARVLFHIDGDFSDVEQKLLQSIHDRHMATIDMKRAISDARGACTTYEEEEKVRQAQERAKGNYLEKAFDYLFNSGDD